MTMLDRVVASPSLCHMTLVYQVCFIFLLLIGHSKGGTGVVGFHFQPVELV